MRSRAAIFFLILILTTSGILFAAADYGESSASLGQFTDEFTDLNYTSVRVDVVRNTTLNAMELNYTVGDGGYGNFTYYFEFEVDYNRVNSNLTDFPILLEIGDNSGIDGQDTTPVFDEVGASYLKIAVTNTTNYEYYVEVERWDSGSEIGILWIAPDVSSLENTTLRLHFDSGVDDNTDYVGLPGSVVGSNVWDAGFAAVYHMGTGTGDEVDSTGNGNTATEVGTVNQVAGQIGYSREFLGSDDHFEFVDADLGIGAGQFTYEAWFNQYTGAYGRIIYTYDPTSGVYISTGDKVGIAYDVHAVTFVSGAAVTIASVGRICNDGTWYYVAYTRDGSNNLDLVIDSVSVDTGTKAGNIDGGGHGHIGNDISHTVEFEGYIDEVRVSTTFRSPDWRNSSYFSGMDDLIYWNPSPSFVGSGFAGTGYFTTTDYLDEANGSILVLMTNTTIPENTGITVEFSEDNATWTLNDWDPLFGGFESIDLRDLNWSSLCYVRYNETTSDPEITPRVYQSRLITTEGPTGAGAPEAVTIIESDFPWIAIAIILFCVAYLLMRAQK